MNPAIKALKENVQRLQKEYDNTFVGTRALQLRELNEAKATLVRAALADEASLQQCSELFKSIDALPERSLVKLHNILAQRA